MRRCLGKQPRYIAQPMQHGRRYALDDRETGSARARVPLIVIFWLPFASHHCIHPHLSSSFVESESSLSVRSSSLYRCGFSCCDHAFQLFYAHWITRLVPHSKFALEVDCVCRITVNARRLRPCAQLCCYTSGQASRCAFPHWLSRPRSEHCRTRIRRPVYASP